MDKEILTIGFDKGEADFSISATVGLLSLEEYNELRQMMIVSIGQMESMYRRMTEEKGSKEIK